MSRPFPAVGAGMVVEVNSNVLQSTSFERRRAAGEIELPVSGLTQDADGNYELPHDVGFVKTVITLTAPFNIAEVFHNAPYNIRTGLLIQARFGQTASLLTPEASYYVLETTDGNRAGMSDIGQWQATLVPYSDEEVPGYFTESS